MPTASDGVVFQVRRRLRARSAVGSAAIASIALVIPLLLDGTFSDAPLRAFLGVLGFIVVTAGALSFLTRYLRPSVTVTVRPAGLRVVRPDGTGGFCAWSKILDVELHTTKNETVIRVHTGFGGGVELPLECGRDAKFLALVQAYGSSTNPLAVFLRARVLG